MKPLKYFFLAVTVVCVCFNSAFSQKLKAEDILAKHLESIAAADKRTSIKTFIAVGEADFRHLTRKSPPVKGRIVLASTGGKNFLGMNLDAVDYPSEKFSFDGSKTRIAFVKLGNRSDLGNFLLSNGHILEEGLFGGTLATSWALGNFAPKKARLSLEGTKKIDGKEVYILGYTVKSGSDVDINLYFDKETFRHVRTEYKRTSSAGIGTRPEQSSRFSETRFKVVEDFADFQKVKDLTLPHSYRITYSFTGQNGTSELEWTFRLKEFAFDSLLDEKTFVID